VGLGYVGIPLALRYAEAGYKVVGFDIDPEKVEKISSGKTYIKHIPDEDIQSAVDRGFEATIDFTRATDADTLILCVPTPLNLHREPDLRIRHHGQSSSLFASRPGGFFRKYHLPGHNG
jgi:UDP-N-acetyl-D-glucosamine dehydrogenase